MPSPFNIHTHGNSRCSEMFSRMSHFVPSIPKMICLTLILVVFYFFTPHSLFTLTLMDIRGAFKCYRECHTTFQRPQKLCVFSTNIVSFQFFTRHLLPTFTLMATRGTVICYRECHTTFQRPQKLCVLH